MDYRALHKFSPQRRPLTSRALSIDFFNPGFYGRNNLESTQIDQILETITDLLNAAIPAFRSQDETKKV